jgi:hypothetical protein
LIPERLMNRAPLLILLATMMTGSPTFAAGTEPAPAQIPASPQIAAALADAHEALLAQVTGAVITQNITVGEVLNRVGGQPNLDAVLAKAQQIGGTRWLDNDTAQIRLLVEGADVSKAVIESVDHMPGKSPLQPEVLRRAMARWPMRTFSATGISTGASDLNRLSPPADDPAWAAVGREDCHKALAMARASAVQHVIDSLRPIDIGTDRTLDMALALPEVNQPLSSWLESRPVRAVEFHADRSVQITLVVPADELWQSLHVSLAKQSKVQMPRDAAGWDWLAKQVEARVAVASGTGVAQTANPAVGKSVSIPASAPNWANQLAQAQATSAPRADRLRTARAAEAMALEKLRQQVRDLPLTDGMTLGQAASLDPRIDQAITKSVNRAKPYQVDYDSTGQAATVHVSMNLADLWSKLANLR